MSTLERRPFLKVIVPYLLYFCILILLNFVSFGKAFDSYFWKDDWQWMWSAHYNHAEFFRTVVGPDWLIRTGVFMYPYVLWLFKYVQDSATMQLIGFFLKCINSFLFAIFLLVITKNKKTAVIGSLLLASYSGGIESYTWHKLNGLATSFVLIGLTFFGLFLDVKKINHFISAYLFFIFGLFSYMGRSAGIASVSIFWGFLHIWKEDIQKRKDLVILGALVSIAVPYLVLVKIVRDNQPDIPPGYFKEALFHINLFFGIIGNLLKNPFIKVDEHDYLSTITRSSLFLGYGLLVLTFVFLGLYIKKRTRSLLLMLLFSGWIFLFYFPNWIYGGGGIYAILSSGHRYLAVSGIGVIGLVTIMIEYLFPRTRIAIFVILIAFNIQYSFYVIGLESSLRNRHFLEPIYNQLVWDMRDDNQVQVIVINTSPEMKESIVRGFSPYTFAFSKGLTKLSQFPVLIPEGKAAIEWLCADSTQKPSVEANYAFANTYKLYEVQPAHIYGWELKEDGSLSNKNDYYRNVFTDCKKNSVQGG